MSDRRAHPSTHAVPTVRRSLGPGWSAITCPGCGHASAEALIDRHGSPYISCRSCRFRALGLSIQTCASLRYLGALLAEPVVRERWAQAIGRAITDAVTPPAITTPTPQTEPVSEEGARV